MAAESKEYLAPIVMLPAVLLGFPFPEVYVKQSVADYATTVGYVESHDYRTSKAGTKNQVRDTSFVTGSYLYEVDGQVFRGWRPELFPADHGGAPGSAILAGRRDFPVGGQFTVHYDPEQNSGSYLKTGYPQGFETSSLAIPCVLAIAAIGLAAKLDRPALFKNLLYFVFAFALSVGLGWRDHGLSLPTDEPAPESSLRLAVLRQLSETTQGATYRFDDIEDGMSLQVVLSRLGRPHDVTFREDSLYLVYDFQGISDRVLLKWDEGSGAYRLVKKKPPGVRTEP